MHSLLIKSIASTDAISFDYVSETFVVDSRRQIYILADSTSILHSPVYSSLRRVRISTLRLITYSPTILSCRLLRLVAYRTPRSTTAQNPSRLNAMANVQLSSSTRPPLLALDSRMNTWSSANIRYQLQKPTDHTPPTQLRVHRFERNAIGSR